VLFYSADRLYKTESDIPPLIEKAVTLGEKPIHHRLLHHTVPLGQVDSARATQTQWMEAAISIDHTPWNAAIYVLAKECSPQWYQLSIQKNFPLLTPQPGSGVQVRELALSITQTPFVSAGQDKLF